MKNQSEFSKTVCGACSLFKECASGDLSNGPECVIRKRLREAEAKLARLRKEAKK